MPDALAIAVYGVHYWSTGYGLPAGEVVVTWYVQRSTSSVGVAFSTTGPCPIERRPG